MSSEFLLVSALSHAAADDAPVKTESAGGALPALRTLFSLTLADGLQPAVSDPGPTATLTGDATAKPSKLLLRVIRQGAGTRLAAVLPHGSHVNGVPTLGFGVLLTRDLIATPDGGLYFVTERVTPHFGPATPEMVGVKCGVCRLKIEAGDFILSCKCGLLLHWETEETTPHKPAADRCDCAVQLRVCPGCGQPLSRESYLTFDPRDLS